MVAQRLIALENISIILAMGVNARLSSGALSALKKPWCSKASSDNNHGKQQEE